MRLEEIYLSEELTEILIKETELYNADKDEDDKLSFQEVFTIIMEKALRERCLHRNHGLR